MLVMASSHDEGSGRRAEQSAHWPWQTPKGGNVQHHEHREQMSQNHYLDQKKRGAPNVRMRANTTSGGEKTARYCRPTIAKGCRSTYAYELPPVVRLPSRSESTRGSSLFSSDELCGPDVVPEEPIVPVVPAWLPVVMPEWTPVVLPLT